MSQESLSLIESIAQKPRQATECPRCTSWWTGLNTSHCTACHRTFTGITAFDKHRDGSHSASTRHCVEPESVGLVDAGRAYPCWGFPGTDTHWTNENPQETL